MSDSAGVSVIDDLDKTTIEQAAAEVEEIAFDSFCSDAVVLCQRGHGRPHA